MIDFTLNTYKVLLKTLERKHYSFIKFSDYLSDYKNKLLVLRQDVDKSPERALVIANLQASLGIGSTFYFRSIKGSWDQSVIEEIVKYGHEVGYHYEDLSFAWAKIKKQGSRSKLHEEELEKKLVEIAIESFSENLEKLRKITSVKTICMHGSPLSRWDSRLLWKYYDYHDFGLIGEPYFDIDFNKALYLTDTGRRWDGKGVSVRDKGIVSSEQGKHGVKVKNANWKVKPVNGSLINMTPESVDFQMRYRYTSTANIIKAIEDEHFPVRAMITIHPQRWTNMPIPWFRELVCQNIKNLVKYSIIKLKVQEND